MTIAGVMSGSSLDGIDIAVVRYGKGQEWRLLDTYHEAYPTEWEEKLMQFSELSSMAYIKMKTQYSILLATMIDGFVKKSQYPVDYISIHGHTMVHLPHDGITEQIGNGGIVSAITGIPTIADFRIGDIALGGVGTPLIPIAEKILFAGYDYYLNLGGIANITRFSEHGIVAYDVCPCNQVLNYFSRKVGMEYDDKGQMAREGSFLQKVNHYLESVEYFEKPPPKSLDNNWIKTSFISQMDDFDVSDVLHTYTIWMAQCIANQVGVDEGEQRAMFVTGGGVHNTFFIERLEKELEFKNCKLVIPSHEIIDFKEAILMTLMGKNYLDDTPNILSRVTGASRDSIGGALYKV